MRDGRRTEATEPVTPIEIELSRIGVDAKVHYRAGTSDERVLREVLFKSPYRRKRLNFDVEAGETWLDLGANIGAFALYCRMREAAGYEPDPGCFKLLEQNVREDRDSVFQVAVTASHDPLVPFWAALSDTDHHRYTAYPMKRSPKHRSGMLPNVCGNFLLSEHYDGCKMDIEGSEGGLLDNGWIPRCEKFVVEYHLWRDPSMEHLRRRLEFLRSKFETVSYPPEFDRMLASGDKEATAFYDRLIFCKGWRA